MTDSTRSNLNSAFWKNRRVFVTGASGLLGSNLVEKLLSLNAEVVALVQDHNPASILFQTPSIQERVIQVRGDLTDLYTLERALNEYEVKTVFHLGAQTIVGIANNSPLSTFESNIRGSYNLLEASRRTKGISEVVVASSDKAYGESEILPYSEDLPLKGEHPYDVSKSCTDLIAKTYFVTYELPVIITRCGNLFGPGDLNWNRLIPGTIRSAFLRESPVIRSDGTFIRDYFFIEDASIGYLELAEKIHAKNLMGEAFNLSNEEHLNVLDLTMLILKLMGREELEPKILNQANYEIKNQFLSSKKVQTELGWRSRYSIEEGLKRTIPWYAHFLERTYAESN